MLKLINFLCAVGGAATVWPILACARATTKHANAKGTEARAERSSNAVVCATVGLIWRID